MRDSSTRRCFPGALQIEKAHRRMVEMKKKKIMIALGHEALGTTLPEQKEAT